MEVMDPSFCLTLVIPFRQIVDDQVAQYNERIRKVNSTLSACNVCIINRLLMITSRRTILSLL